MAFGDTGTMSIKKHCEGASQLDHGDAWVVSVVLEHCGRPITDETSMMGRCFGAATSVEPQRVEHSVRRLRRRSFDQSELWLHGTRG